MMMMMMMMMMIINASSSRQVNNFLLEKGKASKLFKSYTCFSGNSTCIEIEVLQLCHDWEILITVSSYINCALSVVKRHVKMKSKMIFINCGNSGLTQMDCPKHLF